MDCNWKAQIIRILFVVLVTINSSGKTISSFFHIKGITQVHLRRYMRVLEEQMAWILMGYVMEVTEIAKEAAEGL